MMRLVQSCTFRIGKFVNAIVAGGGNCTRSTCCAQVVVGFSSLAWRSTCCRSGIEPSHFPSHSFQIVPVTHSSGSKYFSGKSDDKINGRNEEDVEVEFVNVTSKKKTHVDINDLDLEKFTHEVKVRMPDVGDSEGVIEKWYKKEGDLIQREDVICDIRTDLFTFGMMTDDEKPSIMGKILQAENSEPFKEGTVICTTFHHEDINDKK